MRRVDLGILAYRDAWRRQQEAHDAVAGGGDECILHVEHPHTLTTGRRAQLARSHILATDAELRRLHIDVVETDRGGDVTYHGPGQLVAYPVVRLASRRMSVGGYMCALQTAAADTLRVFGIDARLEQGLPGVWCDDPRLGLAKLCAVGVRVKRGVTLHGLALNVETDLTKFHLIDPCGLGRPVTTMHHLLGHRCPSLCAVESVLHKMLKARLTP